MPNRPYSERNIRKLVRLGNTSLGLTLPVEMLSNLNWKDGQKVKVENKGKKVIISDWKKKSKRS